MDQKSKFNKVMGTGDILMLAFGAMIGWGWVINSGDWIQTAGFMGSVIAILIGGVMVIFVGFTYAELTSAMPQCGGEHIFSYRAMGPTASFVCTWAIILGYVATAAYLVTALSTAITYLFPNFNQICMYTIAGRDVYLTSVVLGAGVAVLITAINVVGVKTAAFLQTVLTITICVVGVLLIVASSITGDSSNLTGQFWNAGNGNTVSSVFKVACMTPFLFVGFDVVPQAAEEMREPYRKLGRLLVFSIILAIAFYLLVVFAVSYVMPTDTMTTEMNSQTGLVTAKAMEIAFHLPAMGKILIVGGLCGIITGLNAFLLGGSRAIYSMSESLMLPEQFGKLGKHKTPTAAVILCGICCFIAPFFGRGVLIWLVDAASFGCVVAYLLVSISFVVLRKKDPDMRRPFKVRRGMLIGIIAICLAGFMLMLYIVPASFSAALTWQEWIVVGGWIVLGVIFYFHSKRKYGKEFGRDIPIEIDEKLL